MKNVKKYKNILAVICAMLLCSLAVAGCGQNSGAAANSAEAVSEAQETETQETETQETEAQVAEEAAEATEIKEETQEGSQAAVNADSGGIAPIDIGQTEKALGAAASQTPSAEDYRVFASEAMGFSFLYLKDHTAYMNPSGAALLAINGDTARTGLFVSVSDSEYMPAKEEYFEGEIFNLQQRYLNAMAIQPQLDTLNVGDHELYGIIYAYSNPSGETIDCTEFIEERDGKYIFYHSRAPHKTSGPELNALGAAMVSLQFDAGYYGAPNVAEGSIPIDEFDTEYTSDSSAVSTQENKASASEFESGFYFDTDPSYLILSDEDVTQVYTGGVMEGAYFSVERVELSESIGDTVVSRMKEVAQMLSVRMIGQPEVQLLEIGDRGLAGFTTTYSSVDGTRTIVAEEYYEEIGGSTYCWYAIYDKGDEVTPDAFGHAMETFTLN